MEEDGLQKRIDALYADEERMKLLDRFILGMFMRYEQGDRIYNFLSKLNDEKFNQLADKFIIWREKYIDYCHDVRRINTDCNVMDAMFAKFEQNDSPDFIPITEHYSSFFAGGFEYRGYCFILLMGQGSVIQLYKKD